MNAPAMAERAGAPRLVSFHVVRGDRFACGARRTVGPSVERVPAAEVPPNSRCLRVGCSNDFAKADREARRAAGAKHLGVQNPANENRIGSWNTDILTACGLLTKPGTERNLTLRLDLCTCAECRSWAEAHPEAFHERDGYRVVRSVFDAKGGAA